MNICNYNNRIIIEIVVFFFKHEIYVNVLKHACVELIAKMKI